MTLTPHRSHAQALVEFGLVLPVLLIMLLGMIDLGRGLVFGVAVQQGAREAARLATSAALDSSVTDSVVLQRLIQASAPAITDCGAVLDSSQACGGGSWTFTLKVTPPLGSPTYSSLAAARTNLQAMGGSRVEVTARGSIAMFAGFLTGGLGSGLSQISVQGDAVMVML